MHPLTVIHILSSVVCRLSFVIFAVCLVCCNDPYPGFKKSDEGIYYKLLMVGERDKCCNYDDYVTVNIGYATMNDSVFFSRIATFQVTRPDFPGSIDKCLTLMCKHDSAQFIISASDFYEKTLQVELPQFLKTDGKMKIFVNLMDVQTLNEYRAFLYWIEDLGEYEKIILKQYISDEKIEIPPTDDGIYFIKQRAGSGNIITAGDTVTIHYEGFFLNGKFFDSTRLRNEPLQFVYGQQWQVIPGLEKAMGRMRNGDKAIVIIPSELAFGADGSVKNIVPPFTPVVFEIELIDVK